MTSIKKIILSTVLLAVVATPFSFAEAYVSVKGYFKSNGTYVAPHVRSNPNGIKYDNYGWTPSQGLYNSSYGTRGASWDTPTYITDPDYYVGKNLYESGLSGSTYNSYTPSYTSKNSYSSYSYTPSYTSSSYSSSYTPTYTSSNYSSSLDDIYKEVSHGWKSYGILHCDSGYKDVGDKCIKPNHGSYDILGSLSCDSGYRNVSGKCQKDTLALRCEISFGSHVKPAAGTDDSCVCASGYQWGTDRNSCVLIPKKETKSIKSYVKSVGDSSFLECDGMGWINSSDVSECLFYKNNKGSYNWSTY